MQIAHNYFWGGLVCIVLLQIFLGLWHISYPFTDGRQHYHWGPPFWLMQAQEMHEIGIVNTRLGLKNYHAHPQLIALPLWAWTGAFGFSEVSIRLFALFVAVLTTLIFALCVRTWTNSRYTLASTGLFATFPVIYIYGRSLNQEIFVTLFLLVVLWGIGLWNKNHRVALPLTFIGVIGMTLSDWSGFVFFGAFFATTWCFFRRNDRVSILLMYMASAAVLGFIIFFTQSYLQSTASSLSVFVTPYIEQWKYRAGLTTEFSWFVWTVRQLQYVHLNFSLPLAGLGFFGLLYGLQKQSIYSDLHTRHFLQFLLSVFAGTLIYALVVPQASGIHLYYQYFYAIPLSFGLVIATLLLQTYAHVFKHIVVLAVVGLLVVNVSYALYRFQHLLFDSTGVTASEIELLHSVRSQAGSRKVIAIDINQANLSWYQNPNIRYYLGYNPEAFLVQTGFPFTKYVIVPRQFSEEFTVRINEKKGFGETAKARLIECSKHLCLFELIDTDTRRKQL